MGRDRLIPLVLYFTDHRGVETHLAWVRSDGRPTPENIQRWVNWYIQSQYPGQVNEAIAKTFGQLLVPTKARIVRQPSREVVATWTAPKFMALPPTPSSQQLKKLPIVKRSPARGKKGSRARLSR